MATRGRPRKTPEQRSCQVCLASLKAIDQHCAERQRFHKSEAEKNPPYSFERARHRFAAGVFSLVRDRIRDHIDETIQQSKRRQES